MSIWPNKKSTIHTHTNTILRTDCTIGMHYGVLTFVVSYYEPLLGGYNTVLIIEQLDLSFQRRPRMRIYMFQHKVLYSSPLFLLSITHTIRNREVRARSLCTWITSSLNAYVVLMYTLKYLHPHPQPLAIGMYNYIIAQVAHTLCM